MKLDKSILKLIASQDKQLDAKIKHGIFLQEIDARVTLSDIMQAFEANSRFRGDGRIDWIKFIKITQGEAELMLQLYNSKFFKTQSLAFQSTNQNIIKIIMSPHLNQKITRLYLECLNLLSVQSAMERIHFFDIQTLYLKFLSTECLNEIAHSLSKQNTKVDKIYLTSEVENQRKEIVLNLDEFLKHVDTINQQVRKEPNGDSGYVLQDETDAYYADLPTEPHYSGKKRSREDDHEHGSNKEPRREGDKHVVATREKSSTDDKAPATPVASKSTTLLSLIEQRKITLTYLETIGEERKTYEYEKQHWESEKAALIQREKQLVSEIAAADAQIKQLQATLDSYKKSKAQSDTMLMGLLQVEGLIMPQPNVAVIGNNSTFFAGHASSPHSAAMQGKPPQAFPNNSYPNR